MKDFMIGLCEALARRTGYAFEYLNVLFMDTVANGDDDFETALVDFIAITMEEDWCYTPAESVEIYS